MAAESLSLAGFEGVANASVRVGTLSEKLDTKLDTRAAALKMVVAVGVGVLGTLGLAVSAVSSLGVGFVGGLLLVLGLLLGLGIIALITGCGPPS